MKSIIRYPLLFLAALLLNTAGAQTLYVPPGNQNYSSLEKNILFNAQYRYSVNQIGTRSFNPGNLFNGRFEPEYLTGFDGSSLNAVVIEISGLPDYHVQLGGYVGFTTRYLPPKKFKIEGFDTYNGLNEWVILADISDNTANYFSAFVGNGSYTKLRYTLYESTDSEGYYAGWIGLSELFFLHGEAVKAYDGLMVQYSENGSVDIGASSLSTDYKLNVNGKIRAKEIKVETANWPDYVFKENYIPQSLYELEKYIKANKHLPGIPSAKEVEEDGISLGELNAKLLKKIEELTLHMIDQNKQQAALIKEVQELKLKLTSCHTNQD